MKLVLGFFALVIAVGIAAPVQAQPTYIEDKGITYALNANGTPRLSALITSTGEQVWMTTFVGPGVPIDLEPTALALDKGVLYVSAFSESIAANTGFVFALEAATGRLVWTSFLAGGGVFSAAAIAKDVVYVASWALTGPSKTTALDATTGELIWQSSTPHPAFTSPTVDRDTVVLVTGGFSGFPTFLVLFDAATGQIVRSVPVP